MSHPRVEVVLPGTTTEDIQNWASRVEVENPINFRAPYVALEITREMFMGVELTFVSDSGPVFSLAIFADQPTEKEREIMEGRVEGAS